MRQYSVFWHYFLLVTTGVFICPVEKSSVQEIEITAEEVWKNAAAANVALQSIEYEIVHRPLGVGAEKSPACTAVIIQQKFSNGSLNRHPFNGQFKSENSIIWPDGKVNRYAFSYDGEQFSLFDYQKNRLSDIKAPDDKAIGSVLGLYWPVPATGKFYFSEEGYTRKNEGGLSLEKEVEVGGTQCYAVRVNETYDIPGGGQVKSSLVRLFEKNSFLYRGVKTDKFELIITKVSRKNFMFPAAEMALHIPAGVQEVTITGKEAKTDGLLPKGSQVQNWELKTASGVKRMSDYKGKIVLFDFWGTWCGPCIRMMPKLQALHEKYKDKGLHVVGVSVQEPASADPAAFAKNKGISYEILAGGDPLLQYFGAIPAFPALYLLNGQGKVIHAEWGARDEAGDDLEKMIRQFLGIK